MNNGRLSANELQNSVDGYLSGKITENYLRIELKRIADLIAIISKVNCSDKELNEILDLCVEKTCHYKKERGKAWNYFTTIISCGLKQVKRKRIFLCN